MFLISRCCTGVMCRYHRGGVLKKRFVEMSSKEDYLTCCPEVDGGMPTPREGCDIINGRAIGRKTKTDYTDEYTLGAQIALSMCKVNGISRAYLLRGSPSCGRDYGIAARLLMENGIKVIPI